MKERDYMGQADKLMERIKRGAFLTVKADDVVNTMTIGWATIGYIWQRPVFMVAVRDSRYTFTLLEKTDNLPLRFLLVTNTTRLLLFAARNQEEILISLKNAICCQSMQGVRNRP